jgi:O-antigen/teichoic acid export membrane protein
VPSVKLNTAANLSARVWTAVVHLAFVPLYVSYLGIEAYGLIGVFTSLLALFALLDLGLSTTLNRELAKLSADAGAGAATQARDLVRTLETLYWPAALLIGAGVALAAPFIARDWVRVDRLEVATVQQAIILMGLTIALQWPASLYAGGLMGLQRQVLLGGINAGVATLRAVGAVLVLAYYDATIEAFFCWQAAASAVQTVATGAALRFRLPRSPEAPRFRWRILSEVWRVAAGMAAISALAVVLTQLDKVILVKLLPLDEFGYYSLAWTVATGLYFLIGPLFSALFPRFTQLVAHHDEAGLCRLYHEGCQWMSVTLLPVAVVIALFSTELVLLWTGDAMLAEHSHVLLSLLILGTALNGLMSLPTGLQLAYGWTRLGIVTNLVAVAALVPAIFVLTSRFGAAGGASAWVMLNGAYVLGTLPLMHRRILRGEQWRWYGIDVGLPLIAALVAAGSCKWLFDHLGAQHLPRMGVLACLTAIGLVTAGAAAAAAPVVRERVAGAMVGPEKRLV